ncbi:2-dehydropantoate 2-reductase [Coraliomargarita parva]|uniref:2-dehydropantoate 2-reductase n=1 Tax=Coraliomargarita parva TaxID=3014050 RepID=UPI0022B4D76B|nr:2-dehydropantoate 2-reductase [Coraliomargarita parva]
MVQNQKKWALVGPGAIGLYYGGLLAKSGQSLSVLGRSDYGVLSEQGIRIRMIDPNGGTLNSEDVIVPAQVARDSREIGSVDSVVIAAKSTYNETMVDDLRPLIEPGRTVVLTLQNGMGNAEYFARFFSETPMLAGLCFVCVNRTAPGVVENYLPGRVEIGSMGDRWPEQAEAMVADFKAAGIKTNFSPALDAALWRKLCWNVPFNGLAIAAGGITTDLILSNPELSKRARVLMEEIQAAAGRAGCEIADSFLQGQFDVTERMGAYKPSSLIDFLDGRAVELESIWGEPLRRGEALGLAMPELARLYGDLRSVIKTS